MSEESANVTSTDPGLSRTKRIDREWYKLMFCRAVDRLVILRWLQQDGYIFDETIRTYATDYGHLDVLDWLHKNS